MIKALRTFRVRPLLPPALQPLTALAMNLRWAWDGDTRELFRWMDPGLWKDVGGNPVALLGRLTPERLEQLADDPAFVAELRERQEDLQRYLAVPRWAQQRHGSLPRVAYFSPEFGLTHALQTYSGGLGVLAGDHLKAASDLGLDLVGVGLLYRHGYFRQYLDADGWQQERYPDLNPFTLPLRRLERDGEPALVEVELAGRGVRCQIWKAAVGRVPLLLLDTDVPGNDPADANVTDRLYGGDVEHRLRQEVVLGVGGTRALDVAVELGEVAGEPQLYHSNEGHAGFLQLERLRRLVTAGMSFEDAVESARSAVLFTTHTPVAAGIDRFPRGLMERYFGGLAAECGVSMDRLMAVGQLPGSPPEAEFNMALMALRLSARGNGVSELHGRVARRMFAGLWPDLTDEEVPIGYVTNGVHAPSWVGREMRAVFDRHLPPDWPLSPRAWERVGEIGDDVLWRARLRARERLVQHVREAVRVQRRRRGESSTALGWVDQLLDPDALTIGFARRFAEYKRGALLLRQPDRLRELLLSTERPVQLVFAGKAHPRDDGGKDLIRQIVHFSEDPALRTRVVFIEDYDIDLARVLFQGSDLWLNTPRRPYEACGTSGQKAVLNGALHCSTLDGWWDEMWDGENGFAIGGTDGYPDAAQQDAADVQSLFELLEWTIVPMFYERGADRLPRRWLARLRRSLQTLAPRVLATRMLEEYTDDFYVPLGEHAQRLTEDGFRRARELAGWRRHIAEGWPHVRASVAHSDDGVAEIGDTRAVEVAVQLGPLDPDDVRVELLHGPVTADGMLATSRAEALALKGPSGDSHRYQGTFVCRNPGEYGLAVRIVPHHRDLLSWADTGLAAWGTSAPAEQAAAPG